MKTTEQTTREQAAMQVVGTICEQQPCKPRRSMSHTDKLPMVYRDGALDADKLPSLMGGKLVYKSADGQR